MSLFCVPLYLAYILKNVSPAHGDDKRWYSKEVPERELDWRLYVLSMWPFVSYVANSKRYDVVSAMEDVEKFLDEECIGPDGTKVANRFAHMRIFSD